MLGYHFYNIQSTTLISILAKHVAWAGHDMSPESGKLQASA